MVIIAVKNQIAITVLLHDHEGNLKTQNVVLNEDNGIEVLFDKLDIFLTKNSLDFKNTQKHQWLITLKNSVNISYTVQWCAVIW